MPSPRLTAAVAAGVLAACSGDKPAHTGADTAATSTAWPTDETGATGLDACIERSGVDLGCPAQGTVAWVVAGAFGCTASSAPDQGLWLRFDLDDVDTDGNPRVRSLRWAPAGWVDAVDGTRIEAFAPAPQLLTSTGPIAPDLTWAGEVEPEAFVAGLSFALAEVPAFEVHFDRPLSRDDVDRGLPIAGTLAFSGAVIWTTGDVQDDASAAGAGCFHTAPQLDPID